MNAYQLRTHNIRLLGFKNYMDYLFSPLWRRIRWRALERDRRMCQVCKNRATQVHHDDYELNTMLGHSIDGLRSVCNRCHKRIESQPLGLLTARDRREASKEQRDRARFSELQQIMRPFGAKQ